MTKKTSKVSLCSDGVTKAIKLANSLTEDFQIDELRDQLELKLETTKAERLFRKVIESLPEGFIENNHWIKQILNGEILSQMETVERLRLRSIFPERVNADALKSLWIVFITSEAESFDKGDDLEDETLPFHRLKMALLWAERVRDVLNKISDINAQPKADPLIGISLPKVPFIRAFSREENNMTSTYIDYDGIIKHSAWYPINIFMEEQTDTRRIKKCVECKKFYWVKRLDDQSEISACEDCNNKVRQRIHQSKNKEENNRTRRRKRYFKECVPFCEKCIRPTTKCSCYLIERGK